MLHLLITLRHTIKKLRVNDYGSFEIGEKNDHLFVVTVEVFQASENISKPSAEGDNVNDCTINLVLDTGAIVGALRIVCQDVFLPRFGMEASVKS